MNDFSGHLSHLRQDYRKNALSEQETGDDPVSFFEKWFIEAREAGEKEPNAMTLATVDASGTPHARIVLLKGIEEGGFVFFTNYESNKGKEIAQSGRAALVFFWQGLERQVRVEGNVIKCSEAYSDAYFDSRPAGSKLSAIVSPQSREIPGRAWLEEKYEQLQQSGEKALSRPGYWGGFIVLPLKMEFWQGRSSRLHDRIVFEKRGKVWEKKRIAP